MISQPIISVPLFATYSACIFIRLVLQTTLQVEHNSGPGILHVWLLPHHHVVGQAMWCAVARFGRIPNFL